MPVRLPDDNFGLEQKLRALEAAWAELCRKPESVAVPDWQKNLLDVREHLIERGRADFKDMETAWGRILKETA